MRVYPWGVCEALSSVHSDLAALKKLLFEVMYEELKQQTESRYYKYRQNTLFNLDDPNRWCLPVLHIALCSFSGNWLVPEDIINLSCVSKLDSVLLSIPCDIHSLRTQGIFSWTEQLKIWISRFSKPAVIACEERSARLGKIEQCVCLSCPGITALFSGNAQSCPQGPCKWHSAISGY